METLVNKIKEKLESSGFNCDVEDTHWSKSFTQMIGGGTISINGQVMQQQGQPAKVEMLFEILYESTVRDVETEKEHRSIMCLFKVTREEETLQDLEINIYPDEFDYFNNLCGKIFNI